MQWLADLDLAHLAQEMEKQNIDSHVLALLTHQQLDELGVRRMGDRVKLIRRSSQMHSQAMSPESLTQPTGALLLEEYASMHLALGRKASSVLQSPSVENPGCPLCLEVRSE